MFKLALLAAAALFSFAGVGNATTVDVLLGDGGAVSYSTGGTLVPNIDLMNIWLNRSPPLSGGAVLQSGTNISPWLIIQPTGSLYGNAYLGVLFTSSATFSLANNGNTFGFTWGTVSSYNSVTLTAANGTSYKVAGSDLIAAGEVASGGQVDVIFNDPSSNIVKVQLTNTPLGEPGFAAANFSGSSATVPLPASAVLFALALVGLFLVSRRRFICCGKKLSGLG